MRLFIAAVIAGIALAANDSAADIKSVIRSGYALQVGGRKLVRTVLGGGSYLSACDPRVVFGLGRDAIHSVTNPIRRLTGAIHIYGGDFFKPGRSEWDAESLRERWAARAVCVTLGSKGALVATDIGNAHHPVQDAVARSGHGDTCGAGDRFAIAATIALAMVGPMPGTVISRTQP